MSGIVGSLNTRGSGLINIGSATDGQVFTGTGAGLPAGFEAAAGGGAWTLIESQVASADATLDFTTGITSTYDTYILVGSALVLNTGGGFDFLASTDGGSSWLSSYSWKVHKKHETGYDGADLIDQSVFDMDYNQEHASGEMASFTIWVDDPSGSADRKGVRSDLLYFDTGGDGAGSISHGSINSTSAVDGFRIDAAGGSATITSGRITLYGISHT